MEWRNRTRRGPATSLVTAAVLAAVTACAPPALSGTAAAPVPARPTGPPAGTGTQQSTGTAVFEGASLSTTAAGRCRTEGLRAGVGRVDAGAGQRYAPLVLTNTSAKSCWVYGFVGLVMFDAKGDALRTRVRRENVPAHRVTLRPGASAHARLHWTTVPSGRETSCPSAARLMIIPPDEVAHLEIPFAGVVCGDGRLDVTPMVSGSRL
ncbi:DUF4232 domain-containing protein [Streptosporangium sp. NPDC020145]|uniref:DUF4232 domain-containing protein n=1 Tax=Streptosporangium sp. NPDC020145 TaxID=3154694 RepID=UPI00341EE50F